MTELEANPYALAGELTLMLAGLWLLWSLVLSPSARRDRQPAVLPAWDAPLQEFVLFLLFVVCGGLAGSLIGGLAANWLQLLGDARTAAGGAGFQLGLLAGAFAHPTLGSRRPPGLLLSLADLLPGFITFAITLPLASATSLLWTGLLQLLGLPAEPQDLVSLFAHARSPVLLAAMVILATVIAPVSEELIFRAGIFRYARTRLPRWIALVLPGAFFASLHVSWATGEGLASFAPLVALAVVFSLAYERTGRIGTVIVAHGLFNLNTILLILAGITT